MNFFKSNKIFLLCFFLIILSASVVRLYKLDQIPSGMSWDEAAIGYNGFAVWKVHRDEWLKLMPISFMSFGDYKAPFAIYLNGFFTLLFGLNIFAVRLPFALSGIFTVIGIGILIDRLLRYFLVSQDKENKKQEPLIRVTVLLSTFIFAFSPWHVFFSRQGFESGLALLWIVYGLNAFLFSFIFQGYKKLLSILTSSLFFAFSMYTYHSAKIFLPLFLIVMLLFFRKEILKEKKKFGLGLIFGFLALVPLIYDTVWGKGAERFSQTSVLGKESLSVLEKISTVFQNYLAHFNPQFLLQGQTTTLRHGDGVWGVLFLTEFILVIGTIVWCVKKFLDRKNAQQLRTITPKIVLFGILWICIGIVPASIGFEIPHSNRALLGYPGFIIIASFGIFTALSKLYEVNSTKSENHTSSRTLLIRSFIGMTALLHFLFFLSFFRHYLAQYSLDSVEAFNYGYKEAFDEVMKVEAEVDKIMFTSKYGQPYIYAIFYRKTDPIIYRGGSLAKFEFPDNVNEGDLIRKNALVIATPEEIPPHLADKLIIAPNGQVRFVIIRTDSE